MSRQEVAYVQPASGPCEVHAWETKDLAARLVQAMRERHGKGGINVCRDCLGRAKVSIPLRLT